MSAPEATRDERWMAIALDEARAAADAGEVPVGAVLVDGERLLARGRNRPIAAHDPTAHAEIDALRAAGEALQNYRFPGAELFVSLEPCTMCAGALIHARIARVVYAAADPKTGGAGSAADVFGMRLHNHQVELRGGVLAAEAGALLQAFFRARR
jgi:tRNA(adenine34) deaminase